jgi:outer membrane protein assembly factor BamB
VYTRSICHRAFGAALRQEGGFFFRTSLFLLTFWAVCQQAAWAADWPQWRYDAYRSAASPEELPSDLRLEWTRVYSERTQAWDDPLNHDLMSFDKVFEPIVLGDKMFIGFNDRDKVVALDIHTGREAWTFYTEGPVRLAPAAWEDKVYFTSDDGYLYCVTARDGTLVWKHRGGPSGRKVLGNERLVSAWPARGGPVIRDGKVFFAASIWPFMGTFISALDAKTGTVVWVNDGTGSQFIKQPHGAPAFAGVAPQGALVATRETLLVPGGRSVPAAFDLATGRFKYFQLDDGGKGNGGSFVAANDTNFFVHTRLRGTRGFDLKSGRKSTTFTIDEPVIAEEGYYSGQPNSSLQSAVISAESKLIAARQSLKDALAEVVKAEEEGSTNYSKATNNVAKAEKKIAPAEKTLASAQAALSNSWSGHVIQFVTRDRKMRWELPLDGTGDIIKAGGRLYAAGTNAILALDLPTNSDAPRVVWSNYVDGQVQRLLAANGKLFAVTLDGRVMAFGKEKRGTPSHLVEKPNAPRIAPQMIRQAKEIIARADAQDGYALWLGVDNDPLLKAVLAESKLRIIAVGSDARKVAQLRREFDAAGWYGSRISLQVGDPATFQAPPYLANLIVIGDSLVPRLSSREVFKDIYESVRPYGGAIWISAAKTSAASLKLHAQTAQLANAKVNASRDGIMIVREGALPGSADWTHQYGDIANTVKSDDRLVKLPLGVLWFGGNSHMDVLPRHGHGPSEQVAGGRLFIQGMNCISARDVYTGRVLWKTEFENLGNDGVYYDSSYTNTPLSTTYNQKHIPGANARGANYVVTAERIYVVVSNACHVLDSRTGKRVQIIELPKRQGETAAPEWGYLGIHDDVLLAGAGFAAHTTRLGLANASNARRNIVDLSASRGLVAMDRHTGQMLWRTEALHGFIHNGIVAGNGRVYCLDKLPKSMLDKLKRRGREVPTDSRITALDLRTGKTVWEANTNVFGTFLSYSKNRDVLLQAGASATDRLRDEAAQGMITYQGSDGAVLWQKLDLKYTGPCVVHNDWIITTPTSSKVSVGGYGLLDGKPRLIRNPLTGMDEPLRIYRTYGCNYPIACENILTFRSGAAGYYDLETHSGTGNFGGFKSGCSANLIAANGILNAPDYTRTCSCAYQNQTSLGLVHMPELEMWTHNQYGADSKVAGQRIRRVGINFGAPGDRISEEGTLWVDYPSVGGSSPNLTVTVTGPETNYFRRYASQFSGAGPAWVMASGVVNAERIIVRPQMKRAIPAPAPAKKADDDEDHDDDEEKAKTTSTDNSERRGRSRSSRTNRTEIVETNVPLPAAEYTVRLYFAEPELMTAGERVFEVELQGRPVARNFDIAAATGGSQRGIVKEFKNVLVADELSIGLKRTAGARHAPVISGVEMILEEPIETAGGQ